MRPLLFSSLLSLWACNSDPGDRVLLQSKGSDTIVMLMVRMSESYNRENPDVVIAVNGGGSGTGIKSLIDGTTDMANASRAIKSREKKMAADNGVEPHEIVIAYDGLAVYVHQDNPIQALDFEQLKCIYSEDGACHRWSDLGVQMNCDGTDEIIKLGRQNNSGTYEHFREEVVGKKGKFTNTLDQSGTQQVIDVIATSKCAIGYGGMGFAHGDVRYACLSKKPGEPCAVPTTEAILAKEYPFSRPLFLYTDGEPTGELKAFLDWALGEKGQEIVLASGFVPIHLSGEAP